MVRARRSSTSPWGWPQRKFFTTGDLRRLRLAASEVPGRAARTSGNMAKATRDGAGVRRRQAVAESWQLGEDIYDEARSPTGSTPAPGRWPSCTSTPASGSGWSPPTRSSWPRSSPSGSASPARWAPWPRPRTASSPAGWSATCCTGRRRPQAVRALAEREGLDLAVRGLLRLDQRHPDAVAGRPRRSRSTRTRSCADTPATGAGRSATSGPGRKAAKIGVPAAWAPGPIAGGGAPPSPCYRRRRSRG